MPLNLLAKKSWNVYNAENIARVKRDEEQARKKEEEEEYRMQVADAESRIDRMRRKMLEEKGEALGISTAGVSTLDTEERSSKRLKYDSTDSSVVRYSHHNISQGLVDKDGHINLFSERGNELQSHRKAEKPAEPPAETLRQLAPELKPWYSTAELVGEKQAAKTEKQLEREGRREQRVLAGSDPLAEMKRHLKATKEVEKQRAAVEAERRRELERLREDDLDGFSLNAPADSRNSRERSVRRDKKHRSDGNDDKRDKESSSKHTRSRSGSRHRHRDRDRTDRKRSPERDDRRQSKPKAHERSRTRDRERNRGRRSRSKERSSRNKEERSPSKNQSEDKTSRRHRYRNRSRSHSRETHRRSRYDMEEHKRTEDRHHSRR